MISLRAGLLACASLLTYSVGTAWNVATFNRHEVAKKLRDNPDLIVLPRPEIAKVSALGFTAFLADMYWIGATHYYGDSRHRPQHFAQLHEYIDLINALAPQFKAPYVFGGAAVPWNTSTGWVNVEYSVRILERGIAEFPADWKLRLFLAYDYSAYQKRYREAGDQLKVAATLPGAPTYLAGLATRMYASAGDLAGATAIAKAIYDGSTDPRIKAAMKRRVAELHISQDVQGLNEAVARFHSLFGRFPRRLTELIDADVLKVIPNEPLGGQYVVDPNTGEVYSTSFNDQVTLFQSTNP